MAVDIQKLFNEEIPAQLAKHADEAKKVGAHLLRWYPVCAAIISR